MARNRDSRLSMCAVALAMLFAAACGGGAGTPAPSGAPPEKLSEASTPAAAPATAPAPSAGAPEVAPPSAEKPAAEKPAAASKPRETSRPAEAKPEPPAPAPAKKEKIVKTLAVGTPIEAEFIETVTTDTAKVGDKVKLRVAQDVIVDGLVVVPAGSHLTGIVSEAVSLKKIGGRAKLGFIFNKIELPSGDTAVTQALLLERGKNESGRDAATIGGSTAGGAALGAVVDKENRGRGALIGAAVGAAAGTGIAAATKGQEIEVPAGTRVTLQLRLPAQVAVER